MSIADELLKLEQLRTSGALSEAEFTEAKRAVLAGAGDHRPAADQTDEPATLGRPDGPARIDEPAFPPTAGPVRFNPAGVRARRPMLRRSLAASADFSGDSSLGRAANRYVSFKIVSAVVGGILFLIVLIAALSHMGSGGDNTDNGPGTIICTGFDPNC